MFPIAHLLLVIVVILPSSAGERDLDTLVPLVIWHGMGERLQTWFISLATLMYSRYIYLLFIIIYLGYYTHSVSKETTVVLRSVLEDSSATLRSFYLVFM